MDLIVKSIGMLAIASPQRAISIGRKGIALIAGQRPDDIDAFTSPEVELWLTELRRASAGLKLPVNGVRSPLATVSVAELRYLRDWNISFSRTDTNQLISEPMFSHVVTLLELLGSDVPDAHKHLDVVVETTPDWRLLKLLLKKNEWSRLQIRQVVDQLVPNAFFSGASDEIRENSIDLSLEVKGIYFEADSPHITAYNEILRRLYETQSYPQNLHRILHDLKNQVIAVRNYAFRVVAEPENKFQIFAAIEQLQKSIRAREAALALFFKASDDALFVRTNLQRTVRDFMERRMASRPENIRLELRENLEAAWVMANGEFVTSILENLTLNAIEAMPKGGLLSVSATYKASDSMLEIQVADTGIGISPEAKQELFTNLRSTKAKGMGLGLATVKQIVDRHRGLVDVDSKLGIGTKFTVLLPLQKAD